MSTSPTIADQLTSLQAAITTLEAAVANRGIQSYRLPTGQEVVRANFAKTLEVMYRERESLRRLLGRSNASRMKLGGFRRPS
jgi:hypothetical protein